MTPEHLHRIRAVYEAAVDTPDAARQAVLERECEGVLSAHGDPLGAGLLVAGVPQCFPDSGQVGGAHG